MKSKIKTEVPTLPLMPADRLEEPTQTRVRTLEMFEPLQEGKLGDLEKFDRLCCLGDELACQRLGSKHHRTNARCWIYPKTCYHCDLIASVDSKAKLLYMTSVQVQLGILNASLPHAKVKSVSKKAKSVNKESFHANRRTRPRRAHRIQAMVSPEESQSVIKSCAIQLRDSSCMVGDTCYINTSDPHTGSDSDGLVDSIEEYAPAEMCPMGSVKKDGLCEQGLFDCERYRRSRAPTPEVPAGSAFGSNDPNFCHLSVDGESVHRARRRDPRYELEFLMNMAG